MHTVYTVRSGLAGSCIGAVWMRHVKNGTNRVIPAK
jgi:hypothetical protein